MSKIIILACLLRGAAVYGQLPPAYNKDDLQVLNEIPKKWERYWNMHRMDSMGSLLDEQVDFVNVAGVWMKGRTETVRDHQQKHDNFRFKTSVWETDSVNVRYILPDMAIVHVGWGISGDYEDENTPRLPRHGLFTWVIKKNKKQWYIIAAHNTNIK